MKAVAPRILAQGLLVLRENAVMPRLVNRDYESDAKMKGQVVDVPLPGSSKLRPVVTSHQDRDADAPELGFTQIPLRSVARIGVHNVR